MSLDTLQDLLESLEEVALIAAREDDIALAVEALGPVLGMWGFDKPGEAADRLVGYVVSCLVTAGLDLDEALEIAPAVLEQTGWSALVDAAAEVLAACDAGDQGSAVSASLGDLLDIVGGGCDDPEAMPQALAEAIQARTGAEHAAALRIAEEALSTAVTP